MADIQESGFGRGITNVAVVDADETLVLTSEKMKVTRQTMRALILAWVTLDSGADTTAVTLRIRDGSTATGTLRSEAIAHETTAALTETWHVAASLDVSGIDEVEFSVTAQQTAGSADGTAHNATILVLLF